LIREDKDNAAFRLSGAQFAPSDQEWRRANGGERKAYWDQVAVYARDAKFRELHKGLDVTGRKMPPRRRERHDRARGPVLLPHFSDSRFRTMLRYNATESGAKLYWAKPWARIVSFHARGEVRGAPARDVIGLSPASQEWVTKKAREWWAGQPNRGLRSDNARTLLMGGDAERLAGAEFVSDWGRAPARTREDVRLFGRPRDRDLATPSRQPLPIFRRFDPPWAVYQQVERVYAAAADLRTSEADIRRAVAGLERSQPLAILAEVCRRLGITEEITTRERALDLIARTLGDRLKETKRLWGAA
jgi:hypothetical protein